jgi:hypothetical protein
VVDVVLEVEAATKADGFGGIRAVVETGTVATDFAGGALLPTASTVTGVGADVDAGTVALLLAGGALAYAIDAFFLGAASIATGATMLFVLLCVDATPETECRRRS